MNKTPETILKDEVTLYLAGAHIFFRRIQSGKVKVRGGWMQLAPEGTADIVVFPANGMPRWIELKAPNCTTAKARKKAQAAFAAQVRALGHRYRLCESLDEVIAFLQ